MKKFIFVLLLLALCQSTGMATARKTKKMVVITTAYDANCKKCGTTGMTFTGTKARKGICAVDPKVIPLGSTIIVPGMGKYHAEDTGGFRGKHIDLCFGRHSPHYLTSRYGIRRKKITIILPKKKRK